MAVKAVPQKYETTDGQAFDNQQDADRHEALIEASREFEEAREKWRRATLRTYKTADGVPFDFGLFRDYWYVPLGYSFPDLHAINFIGWNQEFAIEGERLLLINDEGDKQRRYDVANLYADKREAMKALIKAQREKIQQHEQIVAMRIEELKKA